MPESRFDRLWAELEKRLREHAALDDTQISIVRLQFWHAAMILDGRDFAEHVRGMAAEVPCAE